MGANVDPEAGGAGAVRGAGRRSTRACLHGKARPKVGLLSNGSEEHKGTALTRETHQLLVAAPAPAQRGRLRLRRLRRGARHLPGRGRRRRDRRVHRATSCSKSVEGAAEAIFDMVREEVCARELLAKLGAALMTAGAAAAEAADRLRRARRRPAARRRRRGAHLPRRFERHGDQERHLRRRSFRADRPGQGADGRRWPARASCGRRARAGADPARRRCRDLDSRIVGTGRGMPAKVLTNADLGEDGRHVRRLDRRAHRHPRAPHPGPVAGAPAISRTEAGRKACQLGRASIRRPIDCIIVGTVTPRLPVPVDGGVRAEEAGRPAGRLRLRSVGGLRRVPLRPVDRATRSSRAGSSSACSSSGVEILSRIVDWNDRNTCVLFGDGAGRRAAGARRRAAGAASCRRTCYADGSSRRDPAAARRAAAASRSRAERHRRPSATWCR